MNKNDKILEVYLKYTIKYALMAMIPSLRHFQWHVLRFQIEFGQWKIYYLSFSFDLACYHALQNSIVTLQYKR